MMKKLFLILFTLATVFAASAKDFSKVEDKEENANALDETFLNVPFAQAPIAVTTQHPTYMMLFLT